LPAYLTPERHFTNLKVKLQGREEVEELDVRHTADAFGGSQNRSVTARSTRPETRPY
jgi:hypothetical protein